MADDRSKKGNQDRNRINVNQKHELKYWAEKFELAEDELFRIVKKVGPMVSDVEKELGKKAA